MASRLQEISDRLQHTWAEASQSKRLVIAGTGAMGLAALLGIWAWVNHTDYAVVYSGLNPQTGGAVIALLQKEGTPFRLKQGGSTVEVPAADAAQVRLTLAEQGLPTQASSALWKHLQNEKLGTSSFVEHTTYLRALEASLGRDIESIHGVEKASVNLALPEHTPFLETMPKAKAGVTLRLMPGVTLSNQQVFGIAHLVASSIPGLSSADVTVVDQNGHALTAKTHGANASRILHLQNSVEAHYRKQILALLAPLVGGARNVRVVVDARLDLAKGQRSAVTYGVGHVVTAALLSTHRKGDLDGGSFGIPGALSNQPPGAPLAPLTAPISSAPTALTLSEIKAMIPASQKNDQHFRYVLDKTVAFKKDAPWRLRDLSVSVLVNGTVLPSTATATSVVAPTASTLSIKGAIATKKTVSSISSMQIFTARDLQSMQKMVDNSIHASAQNGTVDVEAMPFRAAPTTHRAWWQQLSPWRIWHAIEWFLFALVALLLLRKPIRELMQGLSKRRGPETVSHAAVAQGPVSEDQRHGAGTTPQVLNDDGAVLDFSGVGEGRLAENMETIKALIRNDSTRALQVVREWIGDLGEGEG
ncbi:flagellar basal-body MS-ring/collar protein FliF [Acidithiobacillus ferriphilus]|uniref:flagellar basal-body MS-ring/collar protein FliF n=1 Tax=Acidithiobacillus ferriphilus TaxID=1689834 RepID=UPI0023304A5E|nr:flagellar basal-body MS-ring/collar protein FliF [Acidithiobacillus ferriphilus]WCE93812.1 flagellar basal-body MS-ring/collar protein FliF [Acidithiobacillus ferriphilus]